MMKQKPSPLAILLMLLALALAMAWIRGWRLSAPNTGQRQEVQEIKATQLPTQSFEKAVLPKPGEKAPLRWAKPALAGGKTEMLAYRFVVKGSLVTLERTERLVGNFHRRRGPPTWITDKNLNDIRTVPATGGGVAFHTLRQIGLFFLSARGFYPVQAGPFREHPLGDRSFGDGQRWLGRNKPLRVGDARAALATTKISCRRTPSNFQQGF